MTTEAKTTDKIPFLNFRKEILYHSVMDIKNKKGRMPKHDNPFKRWDGCWVISKLCKPYNISKSHFRTKQEMIGEILRKEYHMRLFTYPDSKPENIKSEKSKEVSIQKDLTGRKKKDYDIKIIEDEKKFSPFTLEIRINSKKTKDDLIAILRGIPYPPTDSQNKLKDEVLRTIRKEFEF